jgi:hypothetical protein
MYKTITIYISVCGEDNEVLDQHKELLLFLIDKCVKACSLELARYLH